jgi:hypothetical protein
MIAVDVVLLASLQRQGTPTEVVVVGDLGAPGMAAALDELEERISKGDVSAETPVDAAIFGMVGLVWAVTGSLIVSRQPRNRAGWIFCIVGAAVPVNGLAFAYVLWGRRCWDRSRSAGPGARPPGRCRSSSGRAQSPFAAAHACSSRSGPNTALGM